MPHTILLTGATGFLGSHLARHFADRGESVAILKRSTSDTRRIDGLRRAIRDYDVDRDGVARAFQELGRIDIVVHTATCYGRNGESVTEIFEANTAMPLQLLNAAIRGGTATFIHTDTAIDRAVNAYALSKRQFAEWGGQLAGAGKIRFVNLRTEHFYGAGDDPSKFTTHVIRSCLRNVPVLDLTAGEQRRDFVHIDDIISAFAILVDRSESLDRTYLEYGLGSGQAIRVRDFVETAHRLCASHTQLAFGALPYRASETMYSQADISGLRALDWQPRVGLLEGLKMTIAQEKNLI